jgi:cell division control protein 45
MDMDLKKQLHSKLSAIAPEYGLVELSYPSFMRCYGYRSQPLSAADAVEAVSALLDVAGGVRMEVEVEGARNGGEWFGSGKVWEASGTLKRVGDGGSVPLGSSVTVAKERSEEDGGNPSGEQNMEVQWWAKNFWTAFDALSE